MTTPRPWTVLDNEPVKSLEENLRVVAGRLPKGNMNRRMTIAKRSDGGLVFHNAVPLAEAEMKALEAWGKPAFLLVPNGYHRLDIHAFKARYPGMKLLCPEPVRAKVAEVASVDGSYDDYPADDAVSLVTLRGGKIGEGVVVVKSGPRSSLVFGDAVMNIVDLPGLDGLVFKLLGSVGGPRVTTIAKLALVKDKRAFRDHLMELSKLPGLTRLIPSHGELIESDGARVLASVVERY